MAAPAPRLSPASAGHLGRAKKALFRGQYAKCIQACEALLHCAPNHLEGLTLCSQAHLKLGQISAAAQCLRDRLTSDPGNAQVAEDIATLLMHEKKYGLALPYLLHCQSLRGWSADVAYSIGFCQQETGDCAGALKSLQAVIAHNPQMVDAYLRTALLLRDMGRWRESIQFLDLALAVNPKSIVILHFQAELLVHQGLYSTALEKFEQLQALGDKDIEHAIDHAEILARLKKTGASEAKFLEVLKQDPDNRRGLTCYGALLFGLKRHSEALELFKKITQKYSEDASSLVNMGNIYGAQRNFSSAVECYSKAYQVNPAAAELAGSLLYTKSFICDWHNYANVLATLEGDSKYVSSRTFPSVIFQNNPRANLGFARATIKNRFNTTHILGPLNSHPEKQKIRVGFFSCDFYHHATVMLMEGMLREYDRNQFEFFAFSLDVTKLDAYNIRMRELFDHYHDVSQLSDGAVTLLSRQLEIDIAIDLKGFTEGSRTAIFAERAAPVQINYLGFPGSMGAPYMDYMVADHYTITPENRQHFDEKIIYMPDCYQPNNPGRPSPGQGSARPAELPDSKFVFCSFNNTYKLTPNMFDLWLRILKQAPDSVLWMLKTTEQAKANLLDHIEACGMDPSRIVFAPMLMEADHLKRFVHADLFMDSFPCNAHTTASDALWSGVPIITRSGETFASRVAGSILHAVGLKELIADSEQAYEALALKIYRDREYHQQLKRRVKEGIAHGALYDVQTYTRHFERALIEIHELQRAGGQPQDLDVARLRSDALVA